MKKLIIGSFIIMFLAQWAAPASMIWKAERVLSKGKAFQFETQPVDPADPLRGRYVALSFKANTIATPKESYRYGQEVYAEIAADRNGAAYIKSIHKTLPPNGNDYLKIKIEYTNDEGKTFIEYPFEEFYLDEFKAPAAENLYRESMRNSTGHTYALVHVYRGRGVIRDLIINGKSVHSYFK